MEPMMNLFAQYGLLLVFANVLLAQAGLPLPALPTLIVAGALAVNIATPAHDISNVSPVC